MTKRKSKDATDTPDTDTPDTNESEQFYNAETLNPALELMYGQLGISSESETTVHVAKLDFDGKGNEANVWKGDPEQYDLEALAKKFGSGSYRVMVYVKIETGQKVRKIMKVINWLLSPEDELKIKNALLPQTTGSVVSQAQPDVIGAVKEIMGGMQTMVTQLMLEIAKSKPVERDPLQTLEGVKQLATILVPAQQPQRDTFMDVMKGVQLFHQISSETKGGNVVDNEGEVSIPGLITAFMREFRSQRAATPAATQTVPAAAGGQPAITAKTQAEIDAEMENEEMNIVLNYQLKQANKAAQANESAADYADNIYGMIPGDVLQLIGTNPNWFAELCKIAPACQPFAEWYAQLGEQIKLNMIEDGLLTKPATTGETPPHGDNNGGAIKPT